MSHSAIVPLLQMPELGLQIFGTKHWLPCYVDGYRRQRLYPRRRWLRDQSRSRLFSTRSATMPYVLQSWDKIRARIDRVHEEAQKVIAESEWLTLKSRELLDRIRRDNERHLTELLRRPEGQSGG